MKWNAQKIRQQQGAYKKIIEMNVCLNLKCCCSLYTAMPILPVIQMELSKRYQIRIISCFIFWLSNTKIFVVAHPYKRKTT